MIDAQTAADVRTLMAKLLGPEYPNDHEAEAAWRRLYRTLPPLCPECEGRLIVPCPPGCDGKPHSTWCPTCNGAVCYVAPSEPRVVETPLDLADSERFDAPMTIHRPSYLAGWNDAKAGRQYGEGRAPSEPEGPPSPTPSLADGPTPSTIRRAAVSRPDVAPQPEDR